MDKLRQQIMSEVCLHLLTKVNVPRGSDPLDQIWCIDNWISSLDRVLDINVSLDSEHRQLFSLTFDAGRDVPDCVEVERIRTESAIQVKHLVPPPGIKALSAIWWCEENEKKEIFVRRTILMDKNNFSAEKARHMFVILKENLFKLVGREQCNIAS